MKEGYRKLGPDEVLRKGDQYPTDACGWVETFEAGNLVGNRTYRRKIETPAAAVEPGTIPADPGEGYRFLPAGELIEEGDEVFDTKRGRWLRSLDAGFFVESVDAPYRRKTETPAAEASPIPTEPDEGYRFLSVGENIEAGDEMFWVGRGWISIPSELNGTPANAFPRFRRKVEPARPGINRVYLSGPMTGLPELNRENFERAAKSLRSQGFEVVNPHDIRPAVGPDATVDEAWKAALRADLAAMMTCDAVVLLPGWEKCSGANLELHVAHRVGLEIWSFPGRD